MKFGIRKPNYKARFKARTTGKLKRKMKKAVNPFYGKKGVGFIKKSIEVNQEFHLSSHHRRRSLVVAKIQAETEVG